MDINKLLELVERQIETDISDASYRGTLRKAGDYEKSLSHFSRGLEHKTDPHMYRKHGILPLGDPEGKGSKDGKEGKEARLYHPKVDGYDVFVRYLVENDIDNIHFPNVYSIRRINDKSGQHVNKYDIEKLIALKDLEAEEFTGVVSTHLKIGAHSPIGLAAIISNAARFFPEDNDQLKLDSLIEACGIVRKIMVEKKLNMDLNSNNLMARRTSTGLQLVICDPFSFAK